MHRYRLEHRISHADVDLLGELKVTALLGMFEQAAVEASTDAGFDPAWYTRAGRLWVIRRTRLERLAPVGGGDTLALATQVLDWRRARSLRSYEAALAAPGRGTRHRVPEDDALVARGTTDWVYCDLWTGRPVSVPDDVRRGFSGESLGESAPRARALPDGAATPSVDMILTVRASHLDHVTHVNNAAYAGFLEDGAFELFSSRGFDLARMLAAGGALRVRTLDVEYLVDAMAGDELVVRTWLRDATWPESPDATRRTAHLLQTIERRDGTRLLRAASEWVWRNRPLVLGGVPET